MQYIDQLLALLKYLPIKIENIDQFKLVLSGTVAGIKVILHFTPTNLDDAAFDVFANWLNLHVEQIWAIYQKIVNGNSKSVAEIRTIIETELQA